MQSALLAQDEETALTVRADAAAGVGGGVVAGGPLINAPLPACLAQTAAADNEGERVGLVEKKQAKQARRERDTLVVLAWMDRASGPSPGRHIPRRYSTLNRLSLSLSLLSLPDDKCKQDGRDALMRGLGVLTGIIIVVPTVAALLLRLLL